MPFISRICMLLFPLYYFPFLFLPPAHFSVAITTTTATAYGPLLRRLATRTEHETTNDPALLVLLFFGTMETHQRFSAFGFFLARFSHGGREGEAK